MACYKGKDGVVKVTGEGASTQQTVGQITDFSIEETVDTVECTHMGDSARTFQPTYTTWTVSATVRWDPDDAGQSEVVVGDTVALALYPEGDSTGDVEWTGDAIVISINTTVEMEELVASEVEFQGTGALDKSGTVS